MSSRRTPTRRRVRTIDVLGLIAGAAVMFAGLALLLNTGGSSHTKTVRVVVSRPSRREHQPTTSHRTAAASTTATSRLPPASAGSNGSLKPPSSTRSGVLKPGATSSFASFAASLPGSVGIAVAPLGAGSGAVLGDDGPAHGWSTTKVPVLTALLLARGSAGLTPAEQQEAQLAITESDNQSILDLFHDLEGLQSGLVGASQYMQQLFRESGDEQTAVATAPPPPGAATTFGQTEWAPSEAVKFFRALAQGCLLPPSETSYVLTLMEHIVPSESWGLGSASFGVPVAFKGGWGPENGGYLVRQSGVIDPGSSRGVAVSIVAHPPAGSSSFGTGTEMLTETASWLSRELLLAPRHGSSCVNPF